jgi:hypothetical protein
LHFVKPLKDTEVAEGQDIELECTVSKKDLKATWLKNNKALPVDNRIKVTADKDTHKLTIKSAIVEDKAEYCVKIADKTSTAKVFVEGRQSENLSPCLYIYQYMYKIFGPKVLVAIPIHVILYDV